MHRWWHIYVALIALILAIISFSVQANAKQHYMDPDTFIGMVKDAARAEMRDSGVPASFSIAQASYESDWWRLSELAREHNNYHGIKCTAPNEGLPCVRIDVIVGGKRIATWWNKYSSILSGFLWHGRWLHGNKRYAKAFNFIDDPVQFAYVIAESGYAVGNPSRYANIVASRINSKNLTRFDDQETPFVGVYYPNISLLGNPVFSLPSENINFNWRDGNPRSTYGYVVPRDYFSVRWKAKKYFSSGTYRFHTLTDDGVRLWIDNRLIIDKWQDQSATEWTADVSINEGFHWIRMEYYERTGGAVARLWWEKISGATQTSCSTGQLLAQYYSNPSLSGHPVYTRCESRINHDWGGGSPGHGVPNDRFSARWQGQFYFDGGRYRFIARTDDGMRVWVDGRQVIDAWWDQPPTTHQGEISLNRGNHTVKVEWYENGGGAVAQVRWERIHAQDPHCGDRTEPNDSYNQGYWLQPGQRVEGYICPQNDIDWFRFTVDPGDEVRIRLQSLPADYDMVLYVNNAEVARSDRGGTSDEEIVWQARGIGNGTRAYIKVYGWNGAWSRTDSYVISLQKHRRGGGTSCPHQYKAEYFNNRDLRGSPVLVRCEGWPIRHDWGSGSPGSGVPSDNFSARWTGGAYISDGIYTFIARADDGIRVWLNDQILINQWKDQPPTEYRAVRRIRSGEYRIRVEYYEHGGGAVAQFRWERGVHGGPGGYAFCANEGERCSFNGTKDVAYGANGSYTIRRGVRGGIDCSNNVFGDPAPGVFKACYIKESSSGGGGGGGNSSGPTYEIVAKHSGKCLDVEGARPDNGANVQQWACGGGPNQRWRLIRVGGYYKIVAVHSGKCLEVAGGSQDNGANVIQWECHGGDNQLWRLDQIGDAYRIVAKHSGKVLDVAGASPNNGANVQVWQYGGGPNQLWWIRRR